jgi:hypothetical protein
MRKRRAWWWNVTLGLAAIAIGAFVLFDVLDVDGSQFRTTSTESVLTEDASVTIGRFCNMPPIPDAFDANLCPPSQPTAVDVPRASIPIRRTYPTGSTTLARARLMLTPASGSGIPADPV